MLSKRFSGKPMKPPSYSMRDVPKCKRNLEGSCLQEVTDRDHFTDAMAEMVLLCNEVIRRQAQEHHETKTKKSPKRTSSKPLSLEYIADRIDVDDPLFGYYVRTAPSSKKGGSEETSVNSSKLTEGMLQGFICITTFTNWQKTFRWDSLHDSAFSYDDETVADQVVKEERKYDTNGKLSEELESLVRCGDPWNEGIVWPRIAEISLLGGLGCGKTLLSLVIEKLESMPPNGKRNYDYVVLQATDNSVPFYESMGFMRVGAITEEEKRAESETGETNKCAEEQVAQENDSPQKIGNDANPPSYQVVSSDVETYTTKKEKEVPCDIAKKLHVDTWDIIFLNQYVYPDILPRSRLLKGTKIFVPSQKAKLNAVSHAKRSFVSCSNTKSYFSSSAIQWYPSKENDTPHRIAKKFNVGVKDMVKVNKVRIPGLKNHSLLHKGTMLKLSGFNISENKHVPYCHWSFPDERLEDSEPSYMMALKLKRRVSRKTKTKEANIPTNPVESSLAVKIINYVRPPSKNLSIGATDLCAPISPSPGSGASLPTKKTEKKKKKRRTHPEEPIRPKKPKSCYLHYMAAMRENLKDELDGKSIGEVAKIVSTKWKELPDSDRTIYDEMFNKSKKKYNELMENYKKNMDIFRKAHPDWVESVAPSPSALSLATPASAKKSKTRSLFNKVVKLSPEGLKTAGTEFVYYYVLTFIPDLQWCQLAPMIKKGNFGLDKPKAEGRPRWVLVNESEGKEIDMTAGVCKVVRARAMANNPDADKEEWDIVEGRSSILTYLKNGTGLNANKLAAEKNLSLTHVATPFTIRANNSVVNKDLPSTAPSTKTKKRNTELFALPEEKKIKITQIEKNIPRKNDTLEKPFISSISPTLMRTWLEKEETQRNPKADQLNDVLTKSSSSITSENCITTIKFGTN